MLHDMKHFTGREMQSLDWRALVKDEQTAFQRMEKQLQERREVFMLETLAKIVAENPEATSCYYMEFQQGYEYQFHFLGCVDGVWTLPDGVTAPVEVQQVDLTLYKKLVEEGVIKTNI